MVTRIKNSFIAETCFPLVCWKECIKCGKEFIRERGYRANTGPYYGGIGRDRYLCNKCGIDEEHASKVFTQIWDNVKNNRPPAPPAPPLKLNRCPDCSTRLTKHYDAIICSKCESKRRV